MENNMEIPVIGSSKPTATQPKHNPNTTPLLIGLAAAKRADSKRAKKKQRRTAVSLQHSRRQAVTETVDLPEERRSLSTHDMMRL
jgi:hypothetical protein